MKINNCDHTTHQLKNIDRKEKTNVVFFFDFATKNPRRAENFSYYRGCEIVYPPDSGTQLEKNYHFLFNSL